MSDIALIRSDYEKNRIGEAIGELFVAHDRKPDTGQIRLYVEEIEKSPYTLAQIIAGVQHLKTVPMRSVDLASIMQTIQDRISREESYGARGCRICDDGYVVMRNVEDILDTKTFDCQCPRDAKHQHTSLKKWDGSHKITVDGKTYKLLLNKDIDGTTIRPEWYRP